MIAVNVTGIVTGNITGKSFQLFNLGYINGQNDPTINCETCITNHPP